MMYYINPIISQFFSSGLFEYFLAPFICLAFLATVPCIIRQFILRR